MAILSAVIFLTALLVYAIGTYAVLDPMITLWMALAMCSFWAPLRRRPETVNSSATRCWGGLWNGGDDQRLPGAGGAGCRVLPWVIAQKRWREVLTYGWLAVGVCILTVLPWWLSPNANRTSGAISSGWSIFNALPKRCPAQGAVLVLHPVPARRKPAVAGAALGAEARLERAR